MNETLFQILRGRIALLLDAGKPWLKDEESLFAELKTISNPKPLRSDFDYVIAEMETAKQILRQRGDRNVVKCKLTQEGEAELLK